MSTSQPTTGRVHRSSPERASNRDRRIKVFIMGIGMGMDDSDSGSRQEQRP